MPWCSVEDFDELSRTDTGGIIGLADLNITSPNLPFGVQYQAVNPAIFFEAVKSGPSDREAWTFVDLGCGKGRAILLALLLSFKEIIGVEFSPTLAAIARENLSRAGGSQQRDCQVSIIDGDAADYVFSSDKIFLFLFNPFTSRVMEKVIKSLVHTCEHRPAEAFVVYANPLCHELFVGGNYFEVVTSAPKFSCYRFRRAASGCHT